MRLGLYLDTSVWGALADPGEERLRVTKTLLSECAQGRYRPCISPLVEEEIARAPEALRSLLEVSVRETAPAVLEISAEALELAGVYLREEVLPLACRADAVHLAVASVAAVDALVSWNFKHMVNVERRRLVHSVNLRLGHRLIDIVSPFELEGAL